MRKFMVALTVASIAIGGSVVQADPESDRVAFEKYYADRFPSTPTDNFVDGVYAIDAASRAQWEEIEEFPPYELAIDAGQEMWETPFANGKSYADCFENDGAVRGDYPYWDADRKMVVTMELAINECREANGEEPLKYKRGKIAELSAYMSYQSRGQKINVVIPEGDADALAAYEAGKEFYYRKRGQLNFTCFDCHGSGSGSYLRSEMLSPAIGHVTGWPVYRSKWGAVGTLHRRFGGCNSQVRAKGFKAQGEEYRNLEFFLSYMSNGMEYNGPSSRR